jgi:ABC-type transporter Mla subunit MlaD
MRMVPMTLAFVAAGLLSACDGKPECTSELARKKAADLAARITEVAADDPSKLADLMFKLRDLSEQTTAKGDELAAACDAIDTLMAELSK